MSSPAPSRSRRWLWFVWDEIRGLLRTFARGFLATGVVVGSLLALFFVVVILTAPPTPPPPGVQRPADPPLLAKLLFALAYSLVLAAQAGLVVGIGVVIWRLVGCWIIVPIVVIPAAVCFSLWLCSGWLAGEGLDALNALAASATANGFPETAQQAQGMGKSLHGGFEVLAIVLVLLLPFILYDTFWILIDGAFLWQFVQFILAFVLAVLLGLLPSTLLSLGVLSYSFVQRLRRRYGDFKENLPIGERGQ